MMANHLTDNYDNDLQKAERISHLITEFMLGDLTLENQRELDEWVELRYENMLLFEELTDDLDKDSDLQLFGRKKTAHIYRKTVSGISFAAPPSARLAKSFNRFSPLAIGLGIARAFDSIFRKKHRSGERIGHLPDQD